VLTELVGAQVRLLRTLLATIADPDRALGSGLLGHAKARLLAPLPRIGEVNLAQVVAEVGPILDRAGDVEHASAECGATPVTRASGKAKAVAFGWAANPKARQALTTFQQLPAQFTVGGQAVCRRPPTRQAPPPRRPHPGPRLASGHLGLLAHQHRL
jgi:transposase